MRNPSLARRAEADTFNARLGGELRDARERAGLSQAAVGKELGWQRDAISKVECGKNALTVLDYLTLVKFLHATYQTGHPAAALADKLLHRAEHGHAEQVRAPDLAAHEGAEAHGPHVRGS